MKRIISVLLTAAVIIGCLPMMSFAVSADTDTVYSANTDEVYFNAGYAEVGKPISVKTKSCESGLMYKWYIDKQEISNFTDTYIPVESDIESMLTAEVYGADGELIGSANMLISKLPVVYIETKDREPIVAKSKVLKAHMTIQGNSEFNDASVLYDGETEIKGRGNSTWIANKKPYKLKLDSKSDLLGMGKNKHWVLLSNPFDASLSRNKLIYDLAEDMGLDAMSSQWVDVVLNGKVVGNYLLCEHIRIGKGRVNITSWDDVADDVAKAIYKVNKKTMSKDERDELAEQMETDMNWVTAGEVTYKGKTYKISDYYDLPSTDGGYLLEGYDGETPYFNTASGHKVTVSKPEGIGKDMLKEIGDYYSAFESAALSSDFCAKYNGQRTRYSDLADVKSFAKYALINEIFQNQDFPYRSTYMYKDVDGKLIFGPVWDMDMTSGNSTYVYSFNKWTALTRGYILNVIKDPAFVNELYKEYRELRYTAIADMLKPGGDIDVALEKLRESGENNDRIWNESVGFEDDLNNFRLWLARRIDWLDSQMTSYSTLYASLNGGQLGNSGASTLSLDGEKLNISFENDNISYFVVYVNGVETYELPYLGDTAVMFSSIEKESVISVACYDDSDNFLGMSAVTNYREPTSLKITKKPTKLTYSAGETIDLGGLELKAVYSDKTEEIVEPESVLSYVGDCLGAQNPVYNKITDKIGNVYISLRYRGAKADFKIIRIANEDAQKVIEMIDGLPQNNIEDNLNIIFEAKQAYDALSSSAKSRVTNSADLENVMKKVDEYSADDPSSVLGCYIEGVSRCFQRNRLVIVTKGSPNKLRIFYEGSTLTFPVNNRTYCISEKKIGNYSLITVVYLITSKPFTIGAYYNHVLQGELYTLDVKKAYENCNRMITGLSYPKTLASVNKSAELTFSAIGRTEKIRAVGGGADTTVDVKNNKAEMNLIFNSAGTKSIKLSYYADGEWHSYKEIKIFVRTAEKQEGLLAVKYPEATAYDDALVSVATSVGVGSVRLVSDTETLNLAATEKNGYKIWQYNVKMDGSKNYRLVVDSADTGRIIKIEKLDKLLIVDNTVRECRVTDGRIDIPRSILAISDGAFDSFVGTVYCYKDSAAQKYAEKNGISFVNYSCSIDIPTELEMKAGDNFVIKPKDDSVLAPDFSIEIVSSDSSVIPVTGDKITAAAPGYARVAVRSNDGLIDSEIRIFVGGGSTKGDVNGDGRINSLDALIILQHSVGTSLLDGTEKAAADINGDGQINSADALIALRISTMEISIWDYV